MFHCTALEPCLFVCLLLHFMVYSVATVTEAFLALFLSFFRFPPVSLFCCSAENYETFLFFVK